MKDRLWLEDLMPGDLEACNSATGFLQSGFWGSFKARFGWSARAFAAVWKIRSGEITRRPLLVIRRRLGFGISFAYVPWGPELPGDFPPEARSVALQELAETLKTFLPRDTVFIRFDPPWYFGDAENPGLELASPFIKPAANVQAPDTVLVSLDGSNDDILGRMKTKWRYNSRLALKRGVIIHRPDEEGLEIFYSLLKETARRDHISIHHFDYYQTLFFHYREYQLKAPGSGLSFVPELRLYTAEHEGEALAAIVVLFWGSTAVYLYGASSNNKRNLMAPYALQVRAMLDAKEAGCSLYDLFGIPPREDPLHPMAGLYQFKTGFGGRVIHRPGSWDFVYRPLVMKLFHCAESLRKTLRDYRKQQRRKVKKQTAENESAESATLA